MTKRMAERIEAGARVEVKIQGAYKSSRARVLAGMTGTVIKLDPTECGAGQFDRWVAVEMDEPEKVPDVWKGKGYQPIWISDLTVIEDEPTDEEILALFNVPPHDHRCAECGMKMPHVSNTRPNGE